MASTALQTVQNTSDGIYITFRLPEYFIIPHKLSQATPEECASAFLITDRVLQTQDKLCLEEYQGTAVEDIKRQQAEDAEKTLQQLKKEHNKELAHHTSEHTELQKKIARLELLLSESRVSEDVVKQRFLEEAERRVNDANIAAEKRYETLKEFTQKKEKECETARQDILELNAKLQTRQSNQQNSAKKGLDGEQEFEEIVSYKRPDWVLESVGKEKAESDFRAEINRTRVRFEVKKHEKNVTKNDVDKFFRDMKEHPETDIGIFVALHAKIPHRDSITLEMTPTNQYVLFVPKFLLNNIDTVFDFLDALFKVVKVYRTLLHHESKELEVPALKERIHRSTTYTQNVLKRITDTMKHFTEDARAVQDKLDTMTSHIRTSLAAQTDDVRVLLSILSGQELEEEETTSPAAETKKKRAPRAKPTADA